MPSIIRLSCTFFLGLTLIFNVRAEATTDQNITCGAPQLSEQPEKEVQFALQFNRCLQSGEFSNALSIALQAKRFATKTKSDRDDLDALLLEGAALQSMGLYEEALVAYEKIRENSSVVATSTSRGAANNAAVINLLIGQLETAQTIAEQIIRESSADRKSHDHASYIGTLASILLARKQLSNAQIAIADCLNSAKELNNSIAFIYCSQTQAEVWLEERKYQQALEAAKKVISQANETRVLSDLADTYLIQAKALSELQNLEEAINVSKQGILIAAEQRDTDSELKLWHFIDKIFQKKSQWREAHQAQVKINQLSTKLFDNKLAYTLSYQRAQREHEKQQQQISLLQSQNSLHVAEASRAKAQSVITILVSIIVLAVIFIGYSRWIHKRDLMRAEKTNTELHHLNELKDQFLSNTSHELRTPLNGIIGLSDILNETEAPSLSAMGRTQLGLIRDCGVQLSEMVDSILDFSQIRAGKPVVKMESVSLNDVVQKVFAILQPLAQRKSIAFSFNLPENNVYVLADENRLRQVLINLVGNAIKFTETGSVKIEIKSDNRKVQVGVKDTGIGIPHDRLQSIFEPFEQVDGSLRRRQGGVGLGLSIAKELIGAHGAKIEVKSEVGVGTEFSFALDSA